MNKHLGWNAEETITGGTVKSWPIKGQLPGSTLTTKYAVMHKMALVNLMPTSNSTNVSEAVGKLLFVLGSDKKLDFGQIIFDQIIDHAQTFVVLKPIGFPRLICSIILNQHPDMLCARDGRGEPMKEFTISDKLMAGSHKVDVDVPPTVRTAGLPTGTVAAGLVKAYKEELAVLEKRRAVLQRKIAMLEATNDPEETQEGGSNAGGAADEVEIPENPKNVAAVDDVAETAKSQGE